MRVLVVVHGFPPAAAAGAELYAHDLARAVVSRFGDHVSVLTREAVDGAPDYRVRREQRDGLDLHWVNNTYRSVTRFSETYDNPGVRRQAAAVIDAVRPDVAHVHHLTGLTTTILDDLQARGIPVVLTLHDYWMICHRGQLLDLGLRVCRGPGERGCAQCTGVWGAPPAPAYWAARVLRRASGAGAPRLLRILAGAARPILDFGGAERARAESRARARHMTDRWSAVTIALAPSTHARDRFVAAGFPGSRIVVWPVGTDPGMLAAVTRTRSARLRLGFLGSLMASKAPHLLIEAAARLPEGSVTVDLFGPGADYHGDPSYRVRLDPLLKHQWVRAHGFIPRERVPYALATLDVLVVPSIWEETSCLAAREALIAGVPVVASRLGALPETVDEGANGLLFEPGSVDDLARTLQRFLDEPHLLDRLRRGRVSFRTLDDDVSSTRALYQRLIAGEPA